MRTLALSDEILMKVDKAARYIGGEVNSVMKDKNDVDIRFAMCFALVNIFWTQNYKNYSVTA